MPAHLDGEERNWLIVRAAKDRAAGPVQAYAPMLAREAKRVPSGTDWAFEIAWEGVRALAPVEGARAHFEHDGGDALDARCEAAARRACRARCARASACWTASSARSTRRAAERALLESGEGRRLRRLRPARARDGAAPRRALEGPPRAAARRCSTTGVARGAALARLRRRQRAAQRQRGPAASASWPSAARSPYRPATVSDDWRLLEIDTRGNLSSALGREPPRALRRARSAAPRSQEAAAAIRHATIAKSNATWSPFANGWAIRCGKNFGPVR